MLGAFPPRFQQVSTAMNHQCQSSRPLSCPNPAALQVSSSYFRQAKLELSPPPENDELLLERNNAYYEYSFKKNLTTSAFSTEFALTPEDIETVPAEVAL